MSLSIDIHMKMDGFSWAHKSFALILNRMCSLRHIIWASVSTVHSHFASNELCKQVKLMWTFWLLFSLLLLGWLTVCWHLCRERQRGIEKEWANRKPKILNDVFNWCGGKVRRAIKINEVFHLNFRAFAELMYLMKWTDAPRQKYGCGCCDSTLPLLFIQLWTQLSNGYNVLRQRICQLITTS